MAFSTRRWTGILLTGWLITPGAAAGTLADPPVEVPMSVNSEGFITILATIGTAGPFRLLLDTGSNTTLVSSGVARQLGLTAVAKTSVATSAGQRDALVVRLPAVTVGPVTKLDLLAPVVDGKALGTIAPGLDGVLGQDFLQDERYTLDYKRQRISWHTPDDEDARGVRLAMSRAEDRWLVELPQPGNGRAVRMVADSGASVLALFDRGASLPLPVDSLPQEAGVTTIAGSAPTRMVVVRRLSVGSLVLRDRPALLVDRRESAADGVLPLSMFAAVTFDPARAVMIVSRR